MVKEWDGVVGGSGSSPNVDKNEKEHLPIKKSNSQFSVGDKKRIKFGKDVWCIDQLLKKVFPAHYFSETNKNCWVS